MMSLGGEHYRHTISLQQPEARTDDNDNDGGIPQICSNRFGTFTHSQVIGCGGSRGSMVYEVDNGRADFLRYSGSLALKVYPQAVSANERAFFRALLAATASALRDCTGEYGHFELLSHLTAPVAFVMFDGEERGILMKRHDCSLKQLLYSADSTSTPRQNGTLIEMDNSSDDEEKKVPETALRFEKDFAPVQSCEVVAAILFQLVLAVSSLNEFIPHHWEGILCKGFIHNDIHLGNLLIHKQSGRIVLCDFELVSPNASAKDVYLQPPRIERLPPQCRQSPYGLFCSMSDTWAIGLVGLSLLTGIDPLFDGEVLFNDFGTGPLLRRFSESEETVPVLDWETNIQDHVRRLLQRDDATGRRLQELRVVLDFCGKCLSNRRCVTLYKPVDLLFHPLFHSFMDSPQSAMDIVQAWAKVSNGQMQ
ncbi:putative Phosphotransferase enzyme family Choline ethanolamine kinase [Trypanosoma vivax]|nr:hypothetical protein TRVL_06611 [Trypanosoma vivax]KAH8603495.1 putative Phosphotransferase enzyme family Choline ethanolamine kinase [Trypanosoma vivax]